MDSGRTFGWSIKGKNSADVVKANEFWLNSFFRGIKKKIYMKPRLNLSWVDVSLREPVDFQILIFISNLGVELTIYWHENDQINLIPD